MTPCEEKGYKVGDEFEVIGDRMGFKSGQVVTLHRDDGTDSPVFAGDNSIFTCADGDPGAYMWIGHVRKIDKKKPLTEQLRSAITKRDKQAAKATRHAEKLKQREAEVQRLVGALEREVEEATGLVCNIKESLQGGIPDSSIPKGAITHGDAPDGVDVDDPGAWKEWDVIICIESSSDYFTEGWAYEFNRIDHRDGSVEVKRDDEGDTYGSPKAKFRFVRRPS